MKLLDEFHNSTVAGDSQRVREMESEKKGIIN